MLFTLGVGSATSLTGGIITIICDQFPHFRRWQVTLGVCIVGFCSGLIYVTPGGQFMLTLVDHFGANFVIYVMVCLSDANNHLTIHEKCFYRQLLKLLL
jgi:solute carrier family 6 amino acid transporter-like protein 5/7/9/14